MAQWPGQQISPPPASGGGAGSSQRPVMRQIVPPSAAPPTAARPDQARGEAAGAGISEYELRTRPGREQREQVRTETNDRFDQSQRILQAWRTDPAVRDFMEMRAAYIGLRNLQRNPNGANATATIFAFIKSLDPGAAVQRSDAEQASRSSIPQAIGNAYNDAISGNNLSDEQRAEMVEAAADLLESRASAYNESSYRFREQLRGIGISFDEVNTQIPFSGADTARGRDLLNRQRRAYGLPLIRETMDVSRDPGGMPGMGGANVPDAGGGAVISNEDVAVARHITNMARQGASPDQINEYLRQRGRQPLSGDAVSSIRRLRQRGRSEEFPGFAPTPSTARSEPGALTDVAMSPVGSFIIGSSQGTSLGLSDEIGAGFQTLVDTAQGEGTFGENWDRNLGDVQRGFAAAQSLNPTSYALGEIGGSLLLPTRGLSVGRPAAQQALRGGATRAEALGAARGATARQFGVEGAGYGFAHGVGSGTGDLGDRLQNGALEGVIGSAAGGFPLITPSRVSGTRAATVPLVDPVTERLNEPLEFASPAERVAAAQRFGIDLPMDAATDRGGMIIAQGLDNLPGSAGVMNDSRRAVGQQVDDALENVAGGYGSARGLAAQGEAAQRGARDWIERAQGVRGDPTRRGVIGRAYDAIPIRPDNMAVTTNSLNRVREINQRFANAPELAGELNDPAFARYQEGLERGNLTWQDLKDFRSEVGERIGERRFGERGGIGQYRALYAALSEDMRATAQAIGPSALRNFERANNLNRQVEQRIEGALTQLLGPDNLRNPERAATAINQMIRSGRGTANIDRLAQVRASTIKNGDWDEVAGAVIREMGQPTDRPGAGFDPTTFVRSYEEMSEPARNLLFGANNRTLRRSLDDFVSVNQRLARRNSLRNTSNTVPAGIGAGVVGSLGATTATGITNPILALKIAAGGAAGAAAVNRLAHLWTNPNFVRFATGYTRSLERSGGSLGPQQTTRMRQYLARLARSTPSLAADYAEIDRMLFGDPSFSDSEQQPQGN